MSRHTYTLLIVESPTIASIVQNLCPSSVYVLATDGFCWRPGYDPDQNRLKAVADPGKRAIRKELKEQAAAASQIILAADADPSGDFIAWSVHRFLKKPNLRIGRMKSLDRNGIQSMLEQAEPLNPEDLEIRLKNRFLLRKEWPRVAAVPNLQLAGLTAVFGTRHPYRHFLDDKDHLFRSTRPFRCPPDEWITIRKYQHKDVYRVEKPLSTFDLIEIIQNRGLAENHLDAQNSLQRLFQTVLPSTSEALISYPRSAARAFYSETWQHLQKQYLHQGGVSDLKPAYLRDIADSDVPHESIHPISLLIKPARVLGEIPEHLAQVYQIIYDQTMQAVRMPEPILEAYASELSPDVHYFTDETIETSEIMSLRPCLTLSDLGNLLFELGTAKPSRFGRDADLWIEKGWINVSNGVVTPGKEVLMNLKHAESLRQTLSHLAQKMDEEELYPETVRALISS